MGRRFMDIGNLYDKYDCVHDDQLEETRDQKIRC